MLHALALGVDDVEQPLGIDFLAGCEHHHLKQLTDALQEDMQAWPLLHMDHVLLVVEVHWECEI